MKNKQHEYILKAFLKSPIPAVIKRESPALVSVDSVIGGYCTQMINGAKHIKLLSNELITKEERAVFSALINQAAGMEKDELIVYYRLIILAEAVLFQYRGLS